MAVATQSWQPQGVSDTYQLQYDDEDPNFTMTCISVTINGVTFTDNVQSLYISALAADQLQNQNNATVSDKKN